MIESSESIEKNFDYLFKILIIGDASVGKSSLLLRFSDDIFVENYISTIGVDFKFKTFNLGNKVIKIQFWDTAGQERFRSITSSYYRGAHGVLVVFDLSDLESFENVTHWFEEIDIFSTQDVCKILIGTKSDKKRVISRKRIEEFATKYNVEYIETSSKNNTNIDLCIKTITNNVKFGMYHKYPKLIENEYILKENSSRNFLNTCCP